MGRRLFGSLLFFFTLQASQMVFAVPAEDIVKYRQGILFGMGWNVSAMGAMVKGDVPFDREKFIFLAERTATLTPMVIEGFKSETKEVESYTKPNLWENFEDFETRMSKLFYETEKLIEIARNGELGEIKKQFGIGKLKTDQDIEGFRKLLLDCLKVHF